MEPGVPDLPAAVKDKFPFRCPGAGTDILDHPFLPEDLPAGDDRTGRISRFTDQREIHRAGRSISQMHQRTTGPAVILCTAGSCCAARARRDSRNNTLYQFINCSGISCCIVDDRNLTAGFLHRRPRLLVLQRDRLCGCRTPSKRNNTGNITLFIEPPSRLPGGKTPQTGIVFLLNDTLQERKSSNFPFPKFAA